jgi:Fe-S-cluster containining protein
VIEFRFRCLAGCTKCCEERGYVYLTEEDLKRAAAFLNISARAFEARYVYRTAHLLRLRKPRGAQCPFLDERGCRIHQAKPTQCRAFPFWPELVSSARAWRREARRCPGMGRGPRVAAAAALRIAGQMRESYPGMYEP